MIVAQHLSAGLVFSKASVPQGTIEYRLGSANHVGGPDDTISIVPTGRAPLLQPEPSNKLLGYFRRVPLGQLSWRPHPQ
jgi:hypothetical protein